MIARTGTRSSTAAPKRQARKTTKPCPICGKRLGGKKTDHRYRPFCSKRCADIDLARWLGGRYAIPGPPAEATAEVEDEDDREDGSVG